MPHKKLHRSLDDFLAGRLDISPNASPIVPGILDDQDFDWRLDRLRLFLHVVGMLDWYGGVLVSLNHQQWRTRWGQVVDRAHLTITCHHILRSGIGATAPAGGASSSVDVDESRDCCAATVVELINNKTLARQAYENEYRRAAEFELAAIADCDVNVGILDSSKQAVNG